MNQALPAIGTFVNAKVPAQPSLKSPSSQRIVTRCEIISHGNQSAVLARQCDRSVAASGDILDTPGKGNLMTWISVDDIVPPEL